MRRLVAFLLDGVPLCASTEKAVAATLADWRHESARVPSPAARIIVGFRSTIALIRAIVGSAFNQLPAEFRSPFLQRVIAAGGLTSALIAWLAPVPSWAASSGIDHVWLSVIQSVYISQVLVLAIVFSAEATGRRTRQAPTLASGLLLSVVLFVIMFVAVPEAFNYVAQRTWTQYTWAALEDGRLPPMPSPIRLLTGGPTREVSTVYVTFGALNWLALSLSAWAFAVLTFRVRQVASPHRVRGGVAVWSAVLLVLALVVGIRFMQTFPAPRAFVPFFVIQFVLAAGALAISSRLNRTADRGLADQRTAD